MSTVADTIKKLQSLPAKQKELPLVIRVNGVSEGIANMFVGLQNSKGVTFPQIGEEPNCIVIQVTETPVPAPEGPTTETATKNPVKKAEA